VVVNVTVDFLRPALLMMKFSSPPNLCVDRCDNFFKQTIMRGDVQLIDATPASPVWIPARLKPRAIPKDLFMEWRNAE
jgi:hypothetical protein